MYNSGLLFAHRNQSVGSALKGAFAGRRILPLVLLAVVLLAALSWLLIPFGASAAVQVVETSDIGLGAFNDNPKGIWGNDTAIFVAEDDSGSENVIFGYHRSDGTRYQPKDFASLDAAGNQDVEGIWSDGTTMWVADRADSKLYAYKMSDKSHDSAKDITLDGDNDKPKGVWGNETTIWVAQDDFAPSNKIFAYNRSDGTHDSSNDFETLEAAGNQDVEGIWSDGATMWVADRTDGKVFAYNMSDKSRDPGNDFDLHPDNSDPVGIWSDGTRMWVVDSADAKFYIYVLANVATLVKNTGQTRESSTSELTASVPLGAVSFTTGGNAPGYTLSSLGVYFGSVPTATGFTATLNESATVNDADAPGTAKCTLTNPASYTASSVNTFGAPTDCGKLAPKTTYFVVMERDSSAVGTIDFGVTASDPEDSGGADGWSIGDAGYSKGSTDASWSTSGNTLLLEVKGAVINTFATGNPTIMGTLELGSVLTADTSRISDADGKPDGAQGFEYQWVRVDGGRDTDIRGATAPNYYPSDADVGKTLKVKVGFTDNAMNPEGPFISAATAPVPASDTVSVPWSATLTVGLAREAQDNTLGYNLGGPLGSLSDTSIIVRTHTHTVNRLTYGTVGPAASFVLDQALPVPFTLLHGASGNLSSTTAELIVGSASNIYSWAGTGLGWRDGDKVAVALTIPVPPPPLVSNLGETGSSSTVAVNSAVKLAQSFTAGSNSGDYWLDSVDVQIAGTPDTVSAVTVSIYSSDSTGTPGSSVHMLTNPVRFTSGMNTFAAPTGATLDAGAMYFLVVEYTGTGTEFELQLTSSTAESGAAGWSISDQHHQSSPSWSGQTGVVMLQVNGLAIGNATGQPTIMGTVKLGAVLTADTSNIADSDGKPGDAQGFEYQWVRVDGGRDTDIRGATAPNYYPSDADVGKTLKVKVGFTDNAMNPEGPFISAATAPVPASDTVSVPWSATLTVGLAREAQDNTLGYNLGGPLGSLSDTSIIVRTHTHTVNRLTYGTVGPAASFVLDQALPVPFTLLHGASGNLSSTTAELIVGSASNIYSWAGTGLGWRDGDKVAVALTIPVPPPPLVSNLGETADSSTASVGVFGKAAQSFTTGPDTGGYTVTWVEIGTAVGVAPDSVSDVSVSLYSDSNRSSGSSLHTLTNPRTITTGAHTFTALEGAELAPNTTYFVVVEYTGTVLELQQTASDSESGAVGWSIGDDRRHDSGQGWETQPLSLMITVNGTVNPPAAPDGLRAVSLDSQVRLTWIPPLSGTSITKHQYRQSNDDKETWDPDWTDIPESATDEANEGSYTVSDLTNNTEYIFQVRAVNEAGDSPAAELSAVPGALVTNLHEFVQPGAEASPDSTSTQAQSFTTGANPYSYTLNLVQVEIAAAPDMPSGVTASIYSESGGSPGSPLFTLTNPPAFTTGANNFTAPANATLAAHTTYFVVIAYSGTGQEFKLAVTLANSERGVAGWSIGNGTRHGDLTQTSVSWMSMARPLKIQVNGTVNPPPPVLVSNLSESGPGAIAVDGTNAGSQSFTTGANSKGYVLGSVEVKLGNASPDLPSDVTLSIYSESGSSPGSSLHMLANPHTFTPSATNTFIAPADATLAANTTYFVVVEHTGGGSLSVESTSSTTENGEAGWSIGDEHHTGPAPWNAQTGQVLFIQVRGISIVRPSAPMNLEALSGDGEARLIWETADGGSSSIKGHEYRQSTDGGQNWDGWMDIPDSAKNEANANAYTLSSLMNNATYTFQVRAESPVGFSLESNSAVARPLAAGDIWSASLTREGHFMGCANGRSDSSHHCSSKLDPNTFEFRGKSYEIVNLEVSIDNWVLINFASHNLPSTHGEYWEEIQQRDADIEEMKERLNLIVDDREFLFRERDNLQENTYSSAGRVFTTGARFYWGGTGTPGWNTLGSSVMLKLNTGQGLATDITPPALSGALWEDMKNIVELDFSEVLDVNSIPDPSAFTVTAAGVKRPVTGVALVGEVNGGAELTSDLQLMLAANMYGGYSYIVTVSYDPPGTNPLRDEAGNEVAAITNYTVTRGLVRPGVQPSPRAQAIGALSVADALTLEGPDATLDFVVTLAPATDDPVTVDYATSDGTAMEGSDYTAIQGTLTFQPSETTKTVQVPVIDDTEMDDGETVTLTLSNASGASITDGEATGTIRNTENSAGNSDSNIAATGTPAIIGTARVGETLTVDNSGISDADGIENASFSYQWIHSDAGTDTDITGATSSEYALDDTDEGKTIKVQVSFTDDADNEESVTSESIGTVAPRPPLTASHEDVPTSHDGLNSFTFKLHFSEEVELSYLTLRDHAFTVTGGEVDKAERLTLGSNVGWRVTVDPDSDADVTVVLPVTMDCNADGAVCTGSGKKLSTELSLTVPGLAPQQQQNSEATGAPTIGGTPRAGETLTASTTGIADADGLTNVSYSHQWMRDDTDIAGATSSTYEIGDADVGKTIQVRVTFDDDANNEEELTSAATGMVAPRPPLTASFQGQPSSHDGQDSFTFELHFSEEVPVSYLTLRDHAFSVTNGTVIKAQRLTQGSNVGWRITVTPGSDADVTVLLPATTDCDAAGAICTGDGRMLSNRIEFTISGPTQ